MPIQAQLGVVGEVRAKLQEERAEVGVDGVDVVLVHHSRGLNQPGIRLARLRVVAPLRAPHRGLLPRLANEEHAFVPRERGQVLPRDLILALSVREGEQRDALRLGKAFQDCDEGRAERPR